jgi:hypothetical protein
MEIGSDRDPQLRQSKNRYEINSAQLKCDLDVIEIVAKRTFELYDLHQNVSNLYERLAIKHWNAIELSKTCEYKDLGELLINKIPRKSPLLRGRVMRSALLCQRHRRNVSTCPFQRDAQVPKRMFEKESSIAFTRPGFKSGLIGRNPLKWVKC